MTKETSTDATDKTVKKIETAKETAQDNVKSANDVDTQKPTNIRDLPVAKRQAKILVGLLKREFGVEHKKLEELISFAIEDSIKGIVNPFVSAKMNSATDKFGDDTPLKIEVPIKNGYTIVAKLRDWRFMYKNSR